MFLNCLDKYLKTDLSGPEFSSYKLQFVRSGKNERTLDSAYYVYSDTYLIFIYVACR